MIHTYIDAALEVIKVIYDAHPEAIEDNRIASGIQRYHRLVLEHTGIHS